VCKMTVSELWHQLIAWAEDIYGLAGQTQLHLLEKRKRDERVLIIYEGTNEIQRFTILKDLATELAPRWVAAPNTALPHYLGQDALVAEAVRGEVRQRITAALGTFGQD